MRLSTTIGDVPPECVPNVPPSLDVHDRGVTRDRAAAVGGRNEHNRDLAVTAVTVGCAGTAGVVAGMVDADAADSALLPTAFVAWTVQV